MIKFMIFNINNVTIARGGGGVQQILNFLTKRGGMVSEMLTSINCYQLFNLEGELGKS